MLQALIEQLEASEIAESDQLNILLMYASLGGRHSTCWWLSLLKLIAHSHGIDGAKQATECRFATKTKLNGGKQRQSFCCLLALLDKLLQEHYF